MLEGFIKKEHIRVIHAGTMQERLEAVRTGEVAAGNFMEPWISIAQKQGFRIPDGEPLNAQRGGRR